MKNLLLVLLIFYGLSYTLFAQSDDRLKGLDSELEKVLKSLDEMLQFWPEDRESATEFLKKNF